MALEGLDDLFEIGKTSVILVLSMVTPLVGGVAAAIAIRDIVRAHAIMAKLRIIIII